jgi:hypothetical protein
MHRRQRAALLPFLGLAVSIACSKAAPPPPSPSPMAPLPSTPAALRVTEIVLGRAVDIDKRISDKTDTFKPGDTIYVSVGTEGSSPAASLAVHWKYEDGQVVKHDELRVAPAGRAYTEFHISKPGGWPEGEYEVEVSMDGASAGTKSFQVTK